jgi:hypothetical protein
MSAAGWTRGHDLHGMGRVVSTCMDEIGSVIFSGPWLLGGDGKHRGRGKQGSSSCSSIRTVAVQLPPAQPCCISLASLTAIPAITAALGGGLNAGKLCLKGQQGAVPRRQCVATASGALFSMHTSLCTCT